MKTNVLTHKQVNDFFKQSFEYFKIQPGDLILFFVIEMIVGAMTSAVPILGFPVSYVVSMFFTAGWFYVAQKIELKQRLEFEDIFWAFKNKTAPIIIFTLVYLFFIFVSFLPVLLTAGVGVIIAFFKTKVLTMPSFSFGLILSGVLSLLVCLMVFLSALFALPLIIFKNTDILDAMKLSLEANLKNTWPLTWLGIIFIGLMLLAIPTLGLAFLVVVPVTKLVFYFFYKGIFDAHDDTEKISS